MEVTSTEAARRSPAYPQLRDIAARLPAVVGEESEAGVTAAWDATTDARRRPVCRLAMTDWAGAAEADFAPEELAIPMFVHVQLHRLWGRLLQARVDRRHERVRELSAGLVTESGAGVATKAEQLVHALELEVADLKQQVRTPTNEVLPLRELVRRDAVREAELTALTEEARRLARTRDLWGRRLWAVFVVGLTAAVALAVRSLRDRG